MFFGNPFKRKLPRHRGYRLKEILDRDERIRKIIARFEENSSDENDKDKKLQDKK